MPFANIIAYRWRRTGIEERELRKGEYLPYPKRHPDKNQCAQKTRSIEIKHFFFYLTLFQQINNKTLLTQAFHVRFLHFNGCNASFQNG